MLHLMHSTRGLGLLVMTLLSGCAHAYHESPCGCVSYDYCPDPPLPYTSYSGCPTPVASSYAAQRAPGVTPTPATPPAPAP